MQLCSSNNDNTNPIMAFTPTYKQLGCLARPPREIRDMAYVHMFTAGDVSIMQTSTAINKEMSDLIFKHGVCRMNFGYAILCPTMRPNQELAAKIQNISFRANTSCYPQFGALRELDILKVFSGSDVPREVCTVTFECVPITFIMVAFEALSVLKTFTGFEKVVVKIELEWCGEKTWPQSLEDCDLQMVYGRMYQSYQKAMQELQPTLGEVDWDGDVFEGQMAFYPRGAPEGLVRKSPGYRDLFAEEDKFMAPRPE